MLTNSNHKGVMQHKPIINISKYGDSTNEQSKYSLHRNYGEQHHNDDRNINYNEEMNDDNDDDDVDDNNNEDNVRKDSKKSTQNLSSELSSINVTGETSKKKGINQLEVLSVHSLKSSTSVMSSPPVNMSTSSSSSSTTTTTAEILNNPPMLRRGIAYLDMDDGDCTIEEDDEEDQANEYLKHSVHTSNFNVSMISSCLMLSNSAAPHINYHLPINDIFHHFLR
ncbi:unnamed protein product [Trichobilharzia regenti]|uniref:Homeobox protein 2-like n=1 Tax=Trichobilharzia regenti TaxID=157069 RepID=A0A183WL99_TRIRE|nr:unnamed protein product [Trichobilharzia regenti]VDQ08782.1 unnamed protein product [Trichobilharzia regenti]